MSCFSLPASHRVVNKFQHKQHESFMGQWVVGGGRGVGAGRGVGIEIASREVSASPE